MLDAGSATGSERASDDRLDSWKAIAAYLARDVSTVRRWEKTEGLPVHRHRHAARGSAYAYKSELDRWFESRRGDLELEGPGLPPQTADDSAAAHEDEAVFPSREVTPAAPSGGHLRTALIAGAVVAVAGVALALASRTWTSVSSTGFQAREWILIGDMDNRTGNPRLDDTVQYALERELSESPFLHVVSRERIDDTLRLMKRPPDTRLDRAIGLEVCRRDGGIRGMLTGRVEKFGGTYVVSTLIVDPNESGRTMAAADVRAADEEHILDAIHQLSIRIRQALGEALRSHNPPAPLESVTTGSLQALQLYTQGIRAVDQRDWRVGAELLQRAVDNDPDFASARIYLAHCLRNLGRPPEEYLPHAGTAARLAEHQSDREQYFILASYEQMLGNVDKATGLYETLLQLHPDHYWGASNLYGLYGRLDRRSDQWPLMARLAKARPNDLMTNVRAIGAALAAGISLNQIDAMAARARQLTRPENRPALFWEPVFLDFLPAVEAWLHDDVPTTIRLAEEIAARSREHAKMGALMELALGRLAIAEKLVAIEADTGDRESDLALVAFFRGDKDALSSHVAAAREDYGRQLALVVWLSAQTGRVQDAERFFREWSARPDDGHSPTADSPWGASVRAEMELRHRVDAVAVADLERAVRAEDQTRPRYLRGSEALADVLGTGGDLPRSAAVLEEATAVRSRVFNSLVRGESFGGVFWLRARAKLARVYRQMGRVADANRVDAQVSKLLASADPDFKLLP